MELIEALAGQATIAIGHPGRDYETSIRAIDAGAACCTHTFNAMGLFHQHRPALWGPCWSAQLLRGHLRRTAPPPWHRCGCSWPARAGTRWLPSPTPSRPPACPTGTQAGGQRRGGGRTETPSWPATAWAVHHHRPSPEKPGKVHRGECGACAASAHRQSRPARRP